jgi:hypothetical protein
MRLAKTGFGVLGFAIVASAMIAPRPAAAWVQTVSDSGAKLHWDDYCIELKLHTANLPPPLTVESALKMTTAAGAAWGRPGLQCTQLQITTSTTDEAYAPVARDGVNRVIFRKDNWCREPAVPNQPCYDKTVLAITTVYAKADGTILEADVEVNAKYYTWDDLSVKGRTGQDLQSVLTHEFGHLLGLDHNCWEGGARVIDAATGKEAPACGSASVSVRASIMFPTTLLMSSPLRRTMTTDETGAICKIYAAKATTPSCKALAAMADAGAPDAGVADGGSKPAAAAAEETGGCALGGPGKPAPGSALALVAAALVAAVRRRKGRR